jgi:hypothetical protein
MDRWLTPPAAERVFPPPGPGLYAASPDDAVLATVGAVLYAGSSLPLSCHPPCCWCPASCGPSAPA